MVKIKYNNNKNNIILVFIIFNDIIFVNLIINRPGGVILHMQLTKTYGNV